MIFLLNSCQKQILRSNMIKPVPIWSGWCNFMLTPGSICRLMLLSYVVICDHRFIQEGLLFCINYDIESHHAKCRFHRWYMKCNCDIAQITCKFSCAKSNDPSNDIDHISWYKPFCSPTKSILRIFISLSVVVLSFSQMHSYLTLMSNTVAA